MFSDVITKILSFIIALFQIISSFIGYNPSVKLKETDTNYPYVFVHGFGGWGAESELNGFFPYWGTLNGDTVEYLDSIGCESYTSSSGSFSSAWDRACELYAQLTGTQVDYGKAHSEKYGHERFGKIYDKPLFEGWGVDKKVNFVAHSFGGNTVRLLSTLLVNGSQEEINATKDGSLSEFFKGGHDGYIYSITTLASPHNGTTLTDVLKAEQGSDVLKLAYNLFAFAENTPIDTYYNIGISQWNLSKTEADKTLYNKENIQNLIDTADCGVYDLTLHGAMELNNQIETFDNIYYYSYAGCVTKADPETGCQVPMSNTSASAFMQTQIGKYTGTAIGGEYIIDEKWLPNDGVVNTCSAMYPCTEAHKDFDANNVEKGIWQVMPIVNYDHFSFTVGDGIGKESANEFADLLINQINIITDTY